MPPAYEQCLRPPFSHRCAQPGNVVQQVQRGEFNLAREGPQHLADLRLGGSKNDAMRLGFEGLQGYAARSLAIAVAEWADSNGEVENALRAWGRRDFDDLLRIESHVYAHCRKVLAIERIEIDLRHFHPGAEATECDEDAT